MYLNINYCYLAV